MDSVLLQDWITVNGASIGVTQSANSWFDAQDVEDVFFHLETKLVNGSPRLFYETSPSKQESSFLAITSLVPSAGTRVTLALASYTDVPVLHYLRWRLSLTDTYSITFRIWLSTYGYGR